MLCLYVHASLPVLCVCVRALVVFVVVRLYRRYSTHLVIRHPKGRLEDSVYVYNTLSEETAGRTLILLQETKTYLSQLLSSPIESSTQIN